MSTEEVTVLQRISIVDNKAVFNERHSELFVANGRVLLIQRGDRITWNGAENTTGASITQISESGEQTARRIVWKKEDGTTEEVWTRERPKTPSERRRLNASKSSRLMERLRTCEEDP